MGWFSNYQALKDNYCYSRKALEKINKKAFNQANKTNVSADIERAWEIAEKKIAEEDLKYEILKNFTNHYEIYQISTEERINGVGNPVKHKIPKYLDFFKSLEQAKKFINTIGIDKNGKNI